MATAVHQPIAAARSYSKASPVERRAMLGRLGCIASLLALGCAGGSGDPSHREASERPPPTAAGAETSDCVGTPVIAPKRVVRLTDHQLFNAYAALFGSNAAAVITRDEVRPSLADREFPPISGNVGVSELLLARYDRLAQSAMRYVSENAAALTPCGAAPSDKRCVQEFLLSFAEKAFRHPLSVEEQRALTGRLWTDMMGADATLTEALGYGVYAILSSPSFLYRTEFGADVGADGRLTPYELAGALSLFLTDRPPDAELLAAAASNALATPDGVRAEATRLLGTAETRAHLESVVVQYFSFTKARTVILGPEATPGLAVTAGMQASIFHEGELFLKNLLWSAPLGALLTSQRTWTSAELAPQIYGVAPPREVDADGFGPVELSADRAGLLTLSTFLLSGARPTGSSPVARGLAVSRAVACEVNPAFPRDPAVASAIEALSGRSELEKAAYRATDAACAGCHRRFDGFGMVLEPYDAVGRFRTADLEGRPIDATWTTTVLPESVGGTQVTNAAEAGRALAASSALERCMTMSFIDYALTEVSRGGANTADHRGSPTQSCAVERVLARFLATDRTFGSLMREIAASDTLALRAKAE